ncbi:hypothetical protein BCR35DRAFT_290594 [Leucosporidium creatinivorum]|uniref:Glycosyl transferase CAP10 domain-containing protein n=1 Tax=Leucosporidium creatinivorum TaxID=106004 RepID=A0A1Y2FHZ0_9BASI|nr:hypothetical protein BCR35DRAFT_290594 [Leucosporidium creatinivorum]
MPETGSTFSPRKNEGKHERAESTYVPLHQPIFVAPPTSTSPPVAPFALSKKAHQELPLFTSTTATDDLFSPLSSTSNSSSSSYTRDDSKEKRATPPLLSPPLRRTGSGSSFFPALRRHLTPQTNLSRALILVGLTLLYFLLHHRSTVEASGPHPIPSLIARAEKAVTDAKTRRPTTLRDAYEQYILLHDGRRPPKGWDQWWFITEELEACEGEFEELYESLRPWWGVRPSEIRERIEEVARSGAKGLGRVRVKGGTVVDWAEMVKEGLPVGDGEVQLDGTRVAVEQMLKELKERFRVLLPDVDLIINTLEEPRVILPGETRHALESLARKKSTRPPQTEKATFRPLGSTNAFSVIRNACPPSSLARTAALSPAPGVSHRISHAYTSEFTSSLGHFIVDHNLERSSWCDQPDLQDIYATFINPRELNFAEGLFPVFSISKLPGFADILIPSAQEIERRNAFTVEQEIPWYAKAEKVHWRGVASDGTEVGLNWQGWPKSRLVSKTNRPSSWAHYETLLLCDASNQSLTAILPSSSLNSAFADIAFLKPAPDAPQLLEPSFRFVDEGSAGSPYHFKAILDLDYDPSHFLPAMASSSAVILSRFRQTALEHTLRPWFHYVPLSLRLSEFYSLLAYFYSPRATFPLIADSKRRFEGGGRQVVRELGRASRAVVHEEELKVVGSRGAQWASKCARREDGLVYLALVVLEWSRLMHDGREEGLADFVMSRGGRS